MFLFYRFISIDLIGSFSKLSMNSRQSERDVIKEEQEGLEGFNLGGTGRIGNRFGSQEEQEGFEEVWRDVMKVVYL